MSVAITFYAYLSIVILSFLLAVILAFGFSIVMKLDPTSNNIISKAILILSQLSGILVFILLFPAFFLIFLLLLLLPARKRWLYTYLRVLASECMASVCGAKIDVKNKNAMKGSSVFYITVYRNYIEMLAIMAAMPFNIRFISKRSFMSIPFIGFLQSAIGCIGMDEQNISAARFAINEIKESLGKGDVVFGFVEAGKQVHTGLLIAAIEAKCPVIPVCISSEYYPLEFSAIFAKTPSSVTLEIKDPIDTSDIENNKAALMDLSSKILASLKINK